MASLEELITVLKIERDIILGKIAVLDKAIKAIKTHDRINNANEFSRQYRHQLRNVSKGLCSCGGKLEGKSKTCPKCQKKSREQYTMRQ